MMTVHEVSRLTGVSIRALRHYHNIGLLPAAQVTEAGYRLYDESSLRRLSAILLFKELELPLRDIKRVLDDPAYDEKQVLSRQLELLLLKREKLDSVISFARELLEKGTEHMNFDTFSNKKFDEYAEKARETWGSTEAYGEFESKSRGRTREMERALGGELMDIFRAFGKIRDQEADGAEAKELARQLQTFITEHYYTCTDDILRGLGQMYAAGGEFTENIDAAGGEGTAAFAQRSIEAFLSEKQQ